MKKTYLLALIGLFFMACSTDDSTALLNQERTEQDLYSDAKLGSLASDPKEGGGSQSICFNDLAAHVSMNVSGGLNNPIVNFVADVPLTASSLVAYVVKVEVQQLADCEDFNVITGNPVFFGGANYTNVVIASPSIAVLPNQLPACYKWRITFERSARLGSVPCKTVSPWYDAPLF